jgi:FKBP-type peptidyl-prolyl cis-trans isomerase FkpA
MKKLRKEEWVAVAACLAFLTYLFFSGPLMSFFNSSMNTPGASGTELQTGFTTQDVVVGTGAVAEPGDIVTAHYVGKLPDGRVFDSSKERGAPISFLLGSGQVIKGWDQGIVGMKVGGTRVLTIAPDYGYGAQAVGSIPANSTLIFEVELLDVKKGQ